MMILYQYKVFKLQTRCKSLWRQLEEGQLNRKLDSHLGMTIGNW